MKGAVLLLNYNHDVLGGIAWEKEKANQNLFYIASQRKRTVGFESLKIKTSI